MTWNTRALLALVTLPKVELVIVVLIPPRFTRLGALKASPRSSKLAFSWKKNGILKVREAAMSIFRPSKIRIDQRVTGQPQSYFTGVNLLVELLPSHCRLLLLMDCGSYSLKLQM